jgi:hypothetical protein
MGREALPLRRRGLDTSSKELLIRRWSAEWLCEMSNGDLFAAVWKGEGRRPERHPPSLFLSDHYAFVQALIGQQRTLDAMTVAERDAQISQGWPIGHT